MRTITWETDDGHIVQLGGTPPYLFKELTDSLGATAETVKPPRYDGVRTFHTALESRVINITGSLVAYGSRSESAQAAFDRHKSLLAQAFAPNRWGYLTYHSEAGNRRIYCRPIATPTFGSRVTITCTLDIEFTTDSPYWESSDEFVSVVGVQLKMWHFPWVLNPTVFGSLEREALIRNPARELIYPILEITSTAQLVTVANLTAGKHISINRPIAAGQKMIIRTEDASASIWQKNEAGAYQELEDVSHWLTLDSDPWGLLPGDNRVEINNEIPQDTPVTFIKYRLPYMGV